MNLLSRFFGWAIERGYATSNPVRMIPVGKRPQQSPKRDTPWIDDDATVRQLMNGLPCPFNLMFYLGNRSGLRVGEIIGLRMSDIGFLHEGVIRARYSFDGPLKEDKRQVGLAKFVPAADDCGAVMADWLNRRRNQGAAPEDYLFPWEPMPGRVRHAENPGDAIAQRLADAWNAAAKALNLKMTLYQATRHSFVSRNLAADASLDEVSAAVGHSSPAVTRRYYDHFVRKTFSAGLRAGVGAMSNGGKVLPIRPAKVG